MSKRKQKIVITKWKVIVSVILLSIMAVALIFADKLEVLVGYSQEFESHQTTIDKINEASYYVAYIDVGQGNSTFVELPDGKTVLIDGGDIEFGQTVGDFLTERNVTKIDYMIATHADSDHIGGLNYVLDNFEVENIYRPFQISYNSTTKEPNDVDDLGEIYTKIRNANKSANSDNDNSKISRVETSVYKKFITKVYSETYTGFNGSEQSNVFVFYDGLTISGINYEIKFYAPLLRDISNKIAYVEDDGDDEFEENENINLELHSSRTKGYATYGFGVSSSASNDNSAIFTLECFDDMYFFMGDATYTNKNGKTGFSESLFIDSLEDDELAELANVDVLLIAHHGSKYSTSDEFLAIIKPRFVVVSVGSDNTYGHPHDEALDRVANSSGLEDDYLLRTDKNGDVIFANINSELMYYVERQATEAKLKISFRLLIVAITATAIIFVLSIRVKPSKKARK